MQVEIVLERHRTPKTYVLDLYLVTEEQGFDVKISKDARKLIVG